MKSKMDALLQGVSTVAIAGHQRPDGDCVGSCMGMYLYLKENYPTIQADVYLEGAEDVFSHIPNLDQVKSVWQEDRIYDLLLLFDVSSVDRIGVAGKALETAKHSFCVDHHITNPGIAKENHVVPQASSTCEVLYELLDEEKIRQAGPEELADLARQHGIK